MAKQNNRIQSAFVVAVIAIIGAVVNRIRGHDFKGASLWLRVMAVINRFIQPIVFGCLQYFVTNKWEQGLLAAVVMFVGQMPGWGSYIGAILDKKSQAPEVLWIDRIWWFLKPYPVLWGIACLSTRGLFWGVCLAAVIQSPLPLIAGLLMGPIYWLADAIGRRISPTMDTWAAGEILFGPVLFVASFWDHIGTFVQWLFNVDQSTL